MIVQLTFDGQKLTWPGVGVFKATTGLPDLQWPDKQQGKIIRSTLFVLNNSHFMFEN